VRSCESPKPTSVVITIAKATTIEKKYARRENTITAAPSRTLLYCIKTKVAWNCNSPNNHRHYRPGAAPGWHADKRIMAGAVPAVTILSRRIAFGISYLRLTALAQSLSARDPSATISVP
jgi:hypothetical protein